MKIYPLLFLAAFCVPLAGCVTASPSTDPEKAYSQPLGEPDWIRNGEPVEFEGELWYPTDELENLLPSEVYPLGTFREVRFFVDRADVKPWERLYTFFGRNRYRAFEKWQPKP